MKSLKKVFENLSEWRPMPGYSVERRIDLLLSPFLPAFLSEQMGAPVEIIAAEFPIPRRSAGGDPDDNLHVSADFLCFRRSDPPAWVIVELKTEVDSRRGEQDRAYRAAAGRERAMGTLLADLKVAKRRSKQWAGYSKIYWKVKRTSSSTQAIELCYIEPRTNHHAARRRTEVIAGSTRLLTTWSFGLGELARSIDPKGDPLGELVQPFLRGLARSNKARSVRSRRARARRPAP